MENIFNFNNAKRKFTFSPGKWYVNSNSDNKNYLVYICTYENYITFYKDGNIEFNTGKPHDGHAEIEAPKNITFNF